MLIKMKIKKKLLNLVKKEQVKQGHNTIGHIKCKREYRFKANVGI